jgi:hypothetical protein
MVAWRAGSKRFGSILEKVKASAGQEREFG